MAELMDHVRVLADQIGPRPVSTEEEHQTSLYVAQELTDSGYDVSVDEFATPTGVRWALAIAFAIMTLGTIISGIGIFVPGIALSMHIVGLILVAGGIFLYYTETNHNPYLSKMRAGGVSQNVVAKYVPAAVAREKRSRKVVIVAHVDTVRAQPECMPQIVQYTPLMRKILFYDVIALGALVFVRLLPIPWPDAFKVFLWVVSLIGCLYALGAAGCILANRFMPYISGANENASGVAVMLTVAKRLLDPEERAKAAEKKAARAKAAAEELDAKLAAQEAEAELHDAESAVAAGVVPEGAAIEYDTDASQATTVLPQIDPETGLPAIPVADHSADATQIMQPVGAETEAAPAAEAAAEEVAEDTTPHPTYQPLSDDLFAKTSEDAVAPAQVSDEIPALQPETETEAAPAAEAPAVEAAPVAAAPAPAPEPDDGLPSWYHAAKKKAARDLARKESDTEEDDKSAFRSRFADVPVEVEAEPEPEPEPVVETAPEQPESVAEVAAEAPAAEAAPQAVVPVAEPAPAQPAVTPIEESTSSAVIDDFSEEVEALDDPDEDEGLVDIPDDELDELTPDLSGVFSLDPKVISDESKSAGLFRGLTSRIPIIGSSDATEVKDDEDAKLREGIKSIPSFGDDVSPVVPVANPDEYAAAEAAEAAPAVEVAEEAPAPKRELKAKPDRRKPTARHITQEFQPTKAVSEDAGSTRVLSGMRQAAAVSSSYEDTPQSGPEFDDPFAPKTQAWDSRATQSAPARPSYSGQMPAVSSNYSAPSNTSSFPSLTGSFPALSGQMPTIDTGAFSAQADYGYDNSASGAGAFGASDGYTPSGDDFADSFLAPGTTGEIDMPESRFHNAMDKVGGLFNRNKKKGNDRPADAEKWNDDDDFGWKGGAYYEGDDNVVEFPGNDGYGYDEYGYGTEQRSSSPALDAARARAAEIRDSVITMNESDDFDKEVWFVALGASGAGNQGMKNFLELHASELRGALIVNLEAVGSGDIKFVEEEGTGKTRRADRRLLSLVKKAAREVSGRDIKGAKLEWRDTDATPAMLGGMRALTLMGFDGVAPTGWHWTTDSMDIIEEDKLEYVTEVVLDMIENS